jgi:DNA-binding MurR/RpiR family transcriptional regulator
MEDLEAESSSSYATIYRFAKKLGFSGFKALKQALLRDVLREKSPSTMFDDLLIHDEMDLPDIAERVFEFSHQVLDDCKAMLSVDDVARAVDLVVSAGTVLLVGAGTSGVSARYAYTKLFRLGIRCEIETDPVLTKMKAGILTAGDLLFVISSSGRTRLAIEAARLARSRGARVLALTDYAVSPLSKTADVNLHTTPRNVNHHLELEMPLLISQISVVDILQMCCISSLPEGAVEAYRATKNVADRDKQQE